jgi:hypothetical protein
MKNIIHLLLLISITICKVSAQNDSANKNSTMTQELLIMH